MQISAIIVAAGSGQRVGGSIPKQFQLLGGKPVLAHTLQVFQDCDLVDNVLIVAAGDWLPFVSQQIVDRYRITKVLKVVTGGQQRQDSVFAGLRALEADTEIVAIHDGVRPFLSKEKLKEVIECCRTFGAAILAVPPKDTIKIEKAGFVEKTPSRDKLWCVQTPQVFKYDLILKAYEKAYEHGVYHTDDATLVERLGCQVKIVDGEHENMKITVPFDLKIAEIILAAR
ncbi:MAG TPA: 2-C-methyl-D-erythritol 4-phosphate cytidylyltransferase [bacterium]